MKFDKIIKNYRIVIKSPNDCNDLEKVAFYHLVEKGGEVKTDTLIEGINRARFLAFYYVDGKKLIAVAALKQNIDHQNNIFERAGILKLSEKFDLEIGYAYTEKEYRLRGICSNLISELIKNVPSDKLFSTARVGNVGMKKILENLGFICAGNPFRGRLMCKGEYYVQLFLQQ